MNTDQVNSMLTQDNRKLRELLWLRHGCMGLYGGDGEMLCASCGIDFKQDSVGLIEGVFKEHGMRKLVEAQVEKERLAREARTEKTYLREKTAKFDPNDCAAVMCSTAGQHPNAPNAHTVQCAHCKEHDFLRRVNDGGREYFVSSAVALANEARMREALEKCVGSLRNKYPCGQVSHDRLRCTRGPNHGGQHETATKGLLTRWGDEEGTPGLVDNPALKLADAALSEPSPGWVVMSPEDAEKVRVLLEVGRRKAACTPCVCGRRTEYETPELDEAIALLCSLGGVP